MKVCGSEPAHWGYLAALARAVSTSASRRGAPAAFARTDCDSWIGANLSCKAASRALIDRPTRNRTTIIALKAHAIAGAVESMVPLLGPQTLLSPRATACLTGGFCTPIDAFRRRGGKHRSGRPAAKASVWSGNGCVVFPATEVGARGHTARAWQQVSDRRAPGPAKRPRRALHRACGCGFDAPIRRYP